MAKIAPETIQDILAKTDIVELIGETVALSRQGKSYFGLCPFHSEKTPSFSVEPERKFYHCFSCGEKGDAISFLQKTRNLSFVESVEELAHRANMELDFSNYKQEDPHKELYAINQDALQFYKLYLENTKAGQEARDYLHARGITDDIISAFDMGLSPDGYDTLTKTLTSKDILVSDLYDLGLVKQSDKEPDKFYDLFRRRVIIPIKDERGRVVAFSGRTYLDRDQDAPKYINSPQTKLFTKSNVLYHLDRAITAIQQTKRVVLFEGYMDVIAAVRAGIRDSVASMGTSLTRQQVELLKRHTNNVTICYDGDPAGIEATSRAINLFVDAGMEVRIVLLPDRLDPDDYITKYGKAALADFIDNKWIDGLEFEYRKNNMGIDFSKMLDIERFKKTVFDLIKNTSHTIIEAYIKRLASDTSLSEESIRQDFEQYTRRNIKQIRQKAVRPIPIESKYQVADRRILNYLLDDYKYVQDFNREFNGMFYLSDIVRDIRMVIEDLYFAIPEGEAKEITLEQVEALLTDEQRQYLHNRILYKNIDLDEREYVDFVKTLNEYLRSLQIEQWNEQIAIAPTLEEKIKLAEYRDMKLKEDQRWTKKR
jgi:DNA primase